MASLMLGNILESKIFREGMGKQMEGKVGLVDSKGLGDDWAWGKCKQKDVAGNGREDKQEGKRDERFYQR